MKNLSESKRLFIEAYNQGWSLSVCRRRAGLNDISFKQLLGDDPEIKALELKYYRRSPQLVRNHGFSKKDG